MFFWGCVSASRVQAGAEILSEWNAAGMESCAGGSPAHSRALSFGEGYHVFSCITFLPIFILVEGKDVACITHKENPACSETAAVEN